MSTLDSVWNQSFKDYEVIVVNDGSTDESLRLIEALEDDRLNVYSIANKGVSHARNFGVSKAKSNLIVFLDADDLWLEHHLEDLKDLYEKFPECGLYCTAYVKQKDSVVIPSNFRNLPKEHWEGIIPDYFEYSTLNSIAWTSAVMIPKSTFDDIGFFNIAYNSGEDTDLWIRIALKLPVAFNNNPSAIHRLDAEDSLTSSSLSTRRHMDLDKYEDIAKLNDSLKTYLDLNRYAIAIQYKLEGNLKMSKELYSKIDLSNLSRFQIQIYKLPKTMLRSLLKIRNLLRRLDVDYRLFR